MPLPPHPASHPLRRLALAASTALLLAGGAFAQAPPEEVVIIVTGVGTQASESDALQAVDILLADELEERLDSSIGATLAELPGLSTTNFGPAVGRPVIRGFGGDRVRLLTNGLDLIDASEISTDHALSSEGLEAERIEVLRGAAAIPYGGAAIGGVVNIVDGGIPSRRPADGLDGRIYLGGTTVDDGTQLAGRARTGAGPFVFQIEGLRREAGDVRVPGFAKSAALRAEEKADDPSGFDPGPEGVITNTGFEFEVLGAGVSAVGDWGYAGFAVRDFSGQYGLPLEEANQVGIDMEQSRIDANAEINLPAGPFRKATLAAGYIDYRHGENARGSLQTLFENAGYEVRGALLNGEAGDRWSGSVGAQITFRDFSATGVEDFIPPAETEDFGVFGAQRLDLGGYGFEGGLRLETRSIASVTGLDLDFDAVSGSAGAFLRPAEGLFLGASLSRTERAPSNAELFSDGFHPATGTVEIGDASIGKETAWSAEGVLNAEGDGWSVKGAVFFTSFKDFIFLAGTGVDDPVAEAPIFRYFQDDAAFTGFEAFASRRIARIRGAEVHLDAAVEALRAETDTLGNVPYIPPLSVILGAGIEGARWRVRGDVEIVSDAENQAGFERPTGGYTFFDLQAELRPFEDRKVTLLVTLENAFDEEGRLNTSQLKDIVPLPGRNLRVSLALAF